MSWQRAVMLTPCGTCGESIMPGELYRRGDVAVRSVWCVPCAKGHLLEDPPGDVTPAPTLRPPPDLFERFDRNPAATSIRRTLQFHRRDVKTAQTGEREEDAS